MMMQGVVRPKGKNFIACGVAKRISKREVEVRLVE